MTPIDPPFRPNGRFTCLTRVVIEFPEKKRIELFHILLFIIVNIISIYIHKLFKFTIINSDR